MGSMQLEMRLDLYDQLVAELRELGLESEQIAEATDLATKAVNLIYFRIIRIAFEQRKAPHSMQGVPPALQLIGEKFEKLHDFAKWEAPSPDMVQTFVEENGIATADVIDWISDYRHFMATGEIRRRNLFIGKLSDK